MRSVGLDLGARHIAFCEVRDGAVVDRVSVQNLEQLASRIGPNTPPARIAFEASREAWHVHDTLAAWGHEPQMIDTTRVRLIGIGQHKRKNDAIDAEACARAVDADRIPKAHVLSPERRELRKQLAVRAALVETRAQYVTMIRGIARAVGCKLPSCKTENFVTKIANVPLDASTRRLVEPLIATLTTIQDQLTRVEADLSAFCERDPLIALCATVPGVGLIVGATFISVIDDAGRFKNAHSVGAYLGLVPSEKTTGGPNNRRLGAITKQGNSQARAMLVEAAWLILRSKRASDPLYTWAAHIAATRGKCIAAIALARKLAGVLWAMCRDGSVYDASAHAAESAKGNRKHAASETARAEALERAARKLRRAPSRKKMSEVAMA